MCVCIGVLICMDVNHVTFSRAVVKKIRTSSAKLKLLCVPADMGSDRFSDASLPATFEGIYVIVQSYVLTRRKYLQCDTRVRTEWSFLVRPGH